MRVCEFVWGVSISIHALLAESDPGKVNVVEPGLAFLSTLSLRRATIMFTGILAHHTHFYPRSPCGERHSVRPETRQRDAISIHALLAESDRGRQPALSQSSEFLSTLSLRRATQKRMHQLSPKAISIHALLAESDHAPSHSLYLRNNFYPRSPCGERH